MTTMSLPIDSLPTLLPILLADFPLGTILVYFGQSNLVGKLIVLILFLFSLLGWTVMIGKYVDLSRLRILNIKVAKKIQSYQQLFKLNETNIPSRNSPYAQLVLECFRSHAHHRIHSQDNRPIPIIMGHIENALQRAVAQQTIRYESKMVVLGSIVTAAPFMGLLGTVWGVMDAFGSLTGQSSVSIQSLAPGVSGALLTTVAGLLVAIPSVIGYNFLLSHTKLCITELENFASSLADRIELDLLEQNESDNNQI